VLFVADAPFIPSAVGGTPLDVFSADMVLCTIFCLECKLLDVVKEMTGNKGLVLQDHNPIEMISYIFKSSTQMLRRIEYYGLSMT
jgi:hypothetical protein